MWLQLSKSATLALTMTQATILKGREKMEANFVQFGQLDFHNPLFTESDGIKAIRVSGTLTDGSRFGACCKMRKNDGVWTPVSAFVQVANSEWHQTIGTNFSYEKVSGVKKLVAYCR